MVQTKAPAEEPTATWLSRLTKMMQEQFQKYQAQVEILTFKRGCFRLWLRSVLLMLRTGIGRRRSDRKARLVLAEETLQYSEGLGDGSCEGFEPEAEHAMKAVRKASEAAQDFLAKVKLWEEAADSYFSKYYEILPQICSGEEVSSRAKLNEEQGKKKWEKDLRDAKSACYDAYEKLQRAVEVCKKNPLPRRDPEAVAGDSGRESFVKNTVGVRDQQARGRRSHKWDQETGWARQAQVQWLRDRLGARVLRWAWRTSIEAKVQRPSLRWVFQVCSKVP
eukprot:g14913.t1